MTQSPDRRLKRQFVPDSPVYRPNAQGPSVRHYNKSDFFYLRLDEGSSVKCCDDGMFPSGALDICHGKRAAKVQAVNGDRVKCSIPVKKDNDENVDPDDHDRLTEGEFDISCVLVICDGSAFWISSEMAILLMQNGSPSCSHMLPSLC